MGHVRDQLILRPLRLSFLIHELPDIRFHPVQVRCHGGELVVPTTSIWVFKSPLGIFWIATAIFPIYFIFFFSIAKRQRKDPDSNDHIEWIVVIVPS